MFLPPLTITEIQQSLARPPFSPITSTEAEGQDSVISQKEHLVLSLFHCHRGCTASPSLVRTAQGGRGHGSPVSPLALSWPYKKRSLSVSEGLMASPGPLWLIPNEKTLVPLIMLPSAYSLMVAGWASTHSLLSCGQNGKPTWHLR